MMNTQPVVVGEPVRIIGILRKEDEIVLRLSRKQAAYRQPEGLRETKMMSRAGRVQGMQNSRATGYNNQPSVTTTIVWLIW